MADRKPPPRPDPRVDGAPAPVPRRTSLTGIVTGQTSPARREVPPPLPPAHRPQPRPTMTGAPAPPAPQSAPEPPVLRTERGLGPKPPEPASTPPSAVDIPWGESKTRPGLPASSAPPRSISPPGGVKVEVEVGGQRVKFRGGGQLLAKIKPYVGALLFAAATSVAGWFKGYFEGLAAAGRRMAAVEEQQKIAGEDGARRDERIRKLESAVQAQQNALASEAQSNRFERATRDRQLEELRARLPKIEGLPPKP